MGRVEHMNTADDESVANLQRALRHRAFEHEVRTKVVQIERKWAARRPYAAYLSVRLDGWIFDSAGDDVMVCGPQGKPGFKWLKPDAKSLEARLLYALVAAIIQERGAP